MHSLPRAQTLLQTLVLLPFGSFSMQAAEGDAPTATAAEDSPAVWIFHYENDYFGGTDRSYTNGMYFRYISPDLNSFKQSGGPPGSWGGWLDRAPRMQRPEKTLNWTWGIGQLMMTPADISIEAPIPDDRPYAGWLYVDLGIQSKTADTLEIWELTVGVVGPDSRADDLQSWFHEKIGDEEPMGWDNQLENELGLGLTYRQVRRYLLLGNPDQFALEALPSFGAEVGNVRTSAHAGAELRMGWNLPSDFGTSIIRAGGGTTAPYSERWGGDPNDGDLSFVVFVGTEAEVVARDLFLDGNTGKDNSSVEKKEFVGQIRAGLQIGYNAWRLTYTHVQQTRTFEEQDEGHVYGSVAISHLF
jgi:hypothetical protein